MGAGRLTDKSINTLQNYFGMAIRQNKGNILQMRNSIIAVLFHCSKISEDTRHMFCPKTKNSWCRWQYDKINGTSTYKPKVNLPVAIKDEITHIFKDLSKEDLLQKCIHGETQNTNESFNQLIWDRCPKTQFSSKKVVEIAVSSAVLHYNSGYLGLLSVFDKIGLPSGYYFEKLAFRKDTKRISDA